MSKQENEFQGFASRSGFNRALGHFRLVMDLIETTEKGGVLANALADRVFDKGLEAHQILPILQALLIDKYQYKTVSLNLPKTVVPGSDWIEEFQGWSTFDLAAVYHHPEAGVVVFDPKNPEHWKNLGELRRGELLVVYLGAQKKSTELWQGKEGESLLKTAESRLGLLASGQKRPKLPAGLSKGAFVFKAPPAKKVPKTPAEPKASVKASASKPAAAKKGPASAGPATEEKITLDMGSLAAKNPVPSPKSALGPAPAPLLASGKVNQSSRVGVTVTNELFHNGNVEAWKRIIESYTTKYPKAKVTVYYDGEVIHDLNTLFKWGKVKHGTAIFFSVSVPTSEQILDISRLRKYLLEGASPRFEQFLHGPVGKILELF